MNRGPILFRLGIVCWLGLAAVFLMVGFAVSFAIAKLGSWQSWGSGIGWALAGWLNLCYTRERARLIDQLDTPA